MRHKKKIIVLIILVLTVVLNSKTPLSAEGEIYAVGCIDNYPYEYIGDDGNPAGFSVDLLKRIMEPIKIRCRIDLVPYERYLHLKKNSDVDIILGMIRGDSDRDFQYFKTNVKISFSMFANSDSAAASVSDLHNLNVHIAAHDSIALPVLEEIKRLMNFKSIRTHTELDAFAHLKGKKCDAVFMSGISARKVIDHQKLVGIKELPVNLGFFDYGFGVRKGKSHIPVILMQGYSNVFAAGEYDRIYRKWFASEADRNFMSETGIYLSAGIFSIILFILFLLINSFILRRRIKEKTRNLNLSMSELTRAQVQLRESEKRFKGIFNKSPSALMILNPSGKILMFNEAAVKIFGVTNPDELFDLDVINSPVSTEWFKSRMKNYRHVNLEFKFNFELIKQTGYYCTSRSGIMILEIVIMPVEINSGSPDPGYICQFSDNTRERFLLEEIRYNQKKHELIFESIKDGIWEWNLLTGRVRYNRKFFSFLGYKMELFPDDITTLFGFIHESDREYVKKELFEKVFNGRNFNIEYRMIMGNGAVVNVRSRGEAIEWDDNLKPLRIIGIQTVVEAGRSIISRINQVKNDNPVPVILSLNPQFGILDGKTILMVDDNYLIYMYISEMLKKYRVLTLYAPSGAEALNLLESAGDISLIILDHHMPGLDGISTLREIRKKNHSIPVIIQTGELIENTDDLIMREGMNAVLGKPVDENILIETICSLIDRRD